MVRLKDVSHSLEHIALLLGGRDLGQHLGMDLVPRWKKGLRKFAKASQRFRREALAKCMNGFIAHKAGLAVAGERQVI